MIDRFAYLIPMHEGNTDADDLEFWTRRNELFRAYLVDGQSEYTGENFRTRAEAEQWLEDEVAAMGWARADVLFSVDE